MMMIIIIINIIIIIVIVLILTSISLTVVIILIVYSGAEDLSMLSGVACPMKKFPVSFKTPTIVLKSCHKRSTTTIGRYYKAQLSLNEFLQ